MVRHTQKFQKQVLASVISSLTFAAVNTEAQGEVEEVYVTGIRASLQSSMDSKRDAKGVVDSINAEDIGKFPNTNLAESLQRIPGVAINRVNGEGSQITVRGFGPSFNQVTLNGRTLPTADVPVVGGGTDGRSTGGAGRAFDFSNLASDGIKALEVHKTGRGDISSGGIGATVNIITRRPLDDPGFKSAISAKAIADTTVDRGDSITPDIGGFVSWANDTFGASASLNYVSRDSAAASSTSAEWNVIPYGDLLDNLVNDETAITRGPASRESFITLPRDSRYHFSEFASERLNGHLVLEFAPSDAIRMAVDYTFAESEAEELRSDISNWFNRPFSEVAFDTSPIPTTVFIKEPSANQGAAMQQTVRATKDELDSFGVNIAFTPTDNLTVTLDGHSSEAKVSPNAPMGYSRINVGLDMKYAPTGGTISQALDYGVRIPQQIIELERTTQNQNLDNDGLARLVVDPARASSQVANLRTISQINEVDQLDLKANWELSDNMTLIVGTNSRTQENTTDNTTYRQILGNWGAEFTGDVETLLPGSLETYCLSCRFEHHTISGATLDTSNPNPIVYGVRGNAADIFGALTGPYTQGYSGADPRPLNVQGSAFDQIEEEVVAFYAQFDMQFEIAGREASLGVGLRHETTDVTAKTSSLPIERIDWQGNNDFSTFAASSGDGFQLTASYDNTLPSLDFSVDLTSSLKARAAISKTIARATYNFLFASGSVNSPPGPTAYGSIPTADRGNPELLPLESTNFDASIEWYFDDSSYVSFGVFDKTVENFVGTETVRENLFGLRDVSSGAAGSRSGDARAILDAVGADQSEDNLFAATVYVNNTNSLAEAQALFEANQGPDNNILPATYDALELSDDLSPDANDPLISFALNRPVNNKEASLDGFEFQGQHFFGDSGFGVSGSYTLVDGDVGFNVAGAPDASQFAVAGLSDTANFTLIYEKYDVSVRLAYNWRDEFLASTNDGTAFNNPIFVEAYAQYDLNIGYEFSDNLSVSFDAINITEESSRNFSRSREDLHFLRENGARYYLGARYKF